MYVCHSESTKSHCSLNRCFNFLKAIKIVKKIKDVTSLLDATASFELSLSHDDVPVKWMFNNVELKPSDKCKIQCERKAHKLTIQKVDSSSAGEYTAVVGHLQCSAVLMVEGKDSNTQACYYLIMKDLWFNCF